MQTQTISYKQIILLILAILCFVFAFAKNNAVLNKNNSISVVYKSNPKTSKKPQTTGVKPFIRQEEVLYIISKKR